MSSKKTTVSNINFGATCTTNITSLKIALTIEPFLHLQDKIEASLSPDVDTPDPSNIFEFSYTEAESKGNTTIYLSTTNSKNAKFGTYVLKNGKIIYYGLQAINLDLPANSIKYTTLFSLDATQIISQEIDISQKDKKAFVVKFEPAFSEAPKIFATTDSDKEITCTADKDNKVLTCTPTTTNMEEGKEYKIAFQQACEGAKIETGVTVKATKLPNSASHMNLTLLILLIELFLL